MDERTEAQFDALLSDYLDGALAESDAHADLDRFVSLLRDTPSLRARFVAQAEIAGLVGAHFAETQDVAALIERTMVSLPEKPNIGGADQTSAKIMAVVCHGSAAVGRPVPTPGRSWLRWGIAAAVLLLVAGIVGWRYVARNGQALVSVAMLHSTGRVLIRSSLPYQETRTASGNEPLRSTDGVELGAGGSATLTYFDETTLMLTGDSALAWLSLRNSLAGFTAIKHDASLGKRVLLETGTLNVSATKQPADAPMHIYTPHADVEIVGTRFVLIVSSSTTRLDLTEGRVKLTRNSDKQSIVMNENQTCDVTAAGDLAAQPLNSK
jgi:hypothetical protein